MSQTLGKSSVDLGPSFFSLESGAAGSSKQYTNLVRIRLAWRSTHSPESIQSWRFPKCVNDRDHQKISTLSTGDHHPNFLKASACGKGISRKRTTDDPGKSYPPISFRYLENNQFGSRATPRRLTAFSSKRGHSALLLPVDKLKTSPLGDTGRASSIAGDQVSSSVDRV